MMQLLSFTNATKAYADGARALRVLDSVSLDLARGTSVGVYGTRGAGKSTLLRLAAGLELADSGSVRFEGRDMAGMTSGERAWLRRGAIAFIAAEDWRPLAGESVMDHLCAGPLGEGVPVHQARLRAQRALDQVEFRSGAAAETAALSLSCRSRVMLARALVQEPRLLIIDEPAVMPSIGDRDRFYALLRRAVRERRISLLAASEEIAALQGLDVLVSLAAGELCSTEPAGVVVPFPSV